MYKYGYIDKYKYEGDNTVLHVEIPERIVQLSKFSVDGKVPIEIRVDDGRTITNEQRKKAYATINDIAVHTGHMPEFLKEYFKYKMIQNTGCDYFSLSDCTVTVAREYINTILDFCIEHGVILTDTLINRTDDIDRAIYKCIATKICCVSGLKADLHHCTGSKVGMGNNRKKISHSNRFFLPLNREYHDLVHVKGEQWFFNKYKVYGIQVSDETLSHLKYKVDEIEVHEE